MKNKIIQQGLLELIRKNRMTIEILKACKKERFYLPQEVRPQDLPYARKAIKSLELLGFLSEKNNHVQVKDYRKLRSFFKSKEYMLLFAEITTKRTLKRCTVERTEKKLTCISQWGEVSFSLNSSDGIRLLHPQQIKKLLKQNKEIKGLNILYLKAFLEYFSGKTEKVPLPVENILQTI